MKQLTFGKWRLSCDSERTRQAYARIPVGGPESCSCSHCRNFAAARSRAYPAEVFRLFDVLGVDFRREAEVYHLGRLDSGLHEYGGWFHFVGQLGQESEKGGTFDVEGGTAPFTLFFHARPVLVPDCFQGLLVVQMEFTTQVPWLIEDPEPA